VKSEGSSSIGLQVVQVFSREQALMTDFQTVAAALRMMGPPPGLAPPPGLLPSGKLAASMSKCQESSIAAQFPEGLGCKSGQLQLEDFRMTDAKISRSDDTDSESSVTRIPSINSHRSCSESVSAEISVAPTIGSFGHPEMCSRPCIYFAWGPCPKGSYCGFCHLAHRESIGKLDKRQRRIFQKLGEAEMIGLILPHLLDRSKRFQNADDTQEVLQVLSNRLLELVPTGDAVQSITERKVDKLGYVLRQMPFQALVSLIFARADFDVDFLDALNVATARLRAKLPAAVSEEFSSLLWI